MKSFKEKTVEEKKTDKMNNSIKLFNIANKIIKSKNYKVSKCPDNITLEMLMNEFEGYEFNLTINEIKKNKSDIELSNMLWSSYCITLFSGNYGLAILPTDNPKHKIPKLTFVSHGKNETLNEPIKLDVSSPSKILQYNTDTNINNINNNTII